MSLKVKQLVLGELMTNGYVLIEEESGEAAVVDVGDYGERFRAFLNSSGVTELKYILLTHGHVDHIKGVKRLHDDFGGKIAVHREDAACLYNSEKSLADGFNIGVSPIEADIILDGGEKLLLGNTEIEVIHTPGHTPGGVCYKAENHLFSGDTLFAQSIGRTDFPGGNFSELLNSLKKLSSLQGDHKVYPGHEEATTLDYERKYNPYMKGM